ncbi:MAG TPA: hypothetical protein VF797_19545 [Noviherbaspirillum sp.]
MHAAASKCRYEIQHYSPSVQTEEKNRTPGVLAATRQTPVPRAQFFSVATSCLKTIGSRICKALSSAVTAVNRARGAWALHFILFRNGTPEKILSQVKFLEKIIGNDDEKINGVVKWGADNLSKPECTLTRLTFELRATATLKLMLGGQQLIKLIKDEKNSTLENFHKNLSNEIEAHHHWIESCINTKNNKKMQSAV